MQVNEKLTRKNQNSIPNYFNTDIFNLMFLLLLLHRLFRLKIGEIKFSFLYP